VKVNGVPGTTYRVYPGQIFKNVCKRLNIQYKTEQFRKPEHAMQRLNENIHNGIPTGCQVSVFYLPFLPEVFRFHFNAHNLVIYGEEQGVYSVSDPVMDNACTIASDDLVRARFAKGVPEPKGRMYYITGTPSVPDMKAAIYKGIRQTCFFMQSPPLPWFGLNAIAFLSKQIARYPEKLDTRRATLYLGNLIRMQEEIGTGGAGFRFLYAAFLQEAAGIMQNETLSELSKELTGIGDQWRNFAYLNARICKSRSSDVVSFKELSDLLMKIYHSEKSFFARLSKTTR
ncbi:MAG TPA: BtrH N-terminal domain-containing protein, partial [Chitinophagaceae bacterium]|nr:BtrH N-terminal domain-containing protein [Chitinophagaceae bacterium]